MYKWQIYSKKSGRLLIIRESITAKEALDKYATSNGFFTWEDWSNYLKLSSEFSILEDTHKIIVD